MGMYDAIKHDPVEVQKLRAELPTVAQVMIPFWRKQLYNPLASCLSNISVSVSV